MSQTQEEIIATLTKCCNEYARLVKEQQAVIKHYEEIFGCLNKIAKNI